MMRQTSLISILALTMLAPLPAAAAEGEAEATAGGESSRGYMEFWEGEIERIGAMDLYGVTSQLPTGYLSVKWQMDFIKAGSRYDDKRKLGPVMPPIEFTQDDKKLISIDLGLEGHGGGHTFQISYGITDPLDWYIEIPFTYMNVSFNPEVAEIDDEGNKIDPSLASVLGVDDPKEYGPGDFLYSTLPQLGRPAPATSYKGRWLLGDVNTGFSWNYYRTPRMSAALTPRIFLPTGHTPPPEQNILYGTGPELETGIGGWGVSATQGYDFRVFRHSIWIDVIASTEATVGYFFEQKRKYPKNFVKPNPLAQALDPATFPDLSNLEGEFTYLPGMSVDWTVQLQFQIAILGLGVGYGIQHTPMPELNGDPDFISMAEGLELLGAQTAQLMQLGVSTSLIPLYIPLNVQFVYKKVLDGFNTIVFDGWYQLTLQGYAPLFLLWE